MFIIMSCVLYLRRRCGEKKVWLSYIHSEWCLQSWGWWCDYFLAVTVIQKTEQTAGIQAMYPETGSQRDKVWDSDYPDGKE